MGGVPSPVEKIKTASRGLRGTIVESLADPHTGALPISGTGWYRKWFTLPANAKDRFFSIEFDGAMSNAHVWLNGHELGGRPYGYIGFAFDLSPYLRFGAQENVLAVRLTPEERSSRWYPGAGIYRNVWLDVTGPVHVAPGAFGYWSVQAPRVRSQPQFAGAPGHALVHVESAVHVM